MYKVVTLTELATLDPDEYGGYSDDYYDSRSALVRLKADGTLDYVCALDGGEPEDNSFGRDGSWIVGELNKALNEKS